MNRRILTTALLGFITIIILNWSCTKLDTTNLGADLLPVVDNVNTFADTMEIVEAYQEDFLPGDTTSLSRVEDHVLGRIDNDPVFGATNAQVFVQFKPNRFPFYFGESKDTLFGPGLGFDSVVLCLSYKGAWGDTAFPMQLRVTDIPSTTGGEWDSLYKSHRISYGPATGAQIGTGSYNILRANDIIKFAHGRDSVKAQIRIKLDSTWGAKIFYQDSASTIRTGFGFFGNAFYKDSIFRANFKGVGIDVTNNARTLLYTNLNDGTSRLEFHYRKRRSNVIDTTYSTLNLETGGAVSPSATANKVIRNRTIPGVGGSYDNEIYLQTTPGTYARLRIPRLNTYRDTNRIIHRAQLRILQIPGNPMDDKTFSAPNFLYLDLRDSSVAVKHKPIYLDLNPSEYYNPDRASTSIFEPYFPSSVEFGYFGGFVKTRVDPITGLPQAYYDFNISRYLQKMLVSQAPNKVPNYELRLFAPYSFSYPQLSESVIGYPNNLGAGRVKVGGSEGAYKIELIVIYSKIKTL